MATEARFGVPGTGVWIDFGAFWGKQQTPFLVCIVCRRKVGSFIKAQKGISFAILRYSDQKKEPYLKNIERVAWGKA